MPPISLREMFIPEILARTIDRRAVDPVVAQRSTRGFNMAEVKRELRRWASTPTERLDALHELGISAT